MGFFLIAKVFVVMFQELNIKNESLKQTHFPIWMQIKTPNCSPNNFLEFQILDGVLLRLHLSNKSLKPRFLQVKAIQ